jgi:hypothetical protein
VMLAVCCGNSCQILPLICAHMHVTSVSASSRYLPTESSLLFFQVGAVSCHVTLWAACHAGMDGMAPDVLSVLLAPTVTPTEVSMCVWHALLDRLPCSGQAKLVPTAPLSACVMLVTAHLQGVHRNVQSAPAPSIRGMSIAPLLPHFKTPSPPVFNALTCQADKSLVMPVASVHPTPPGLQLTVQMPRQSHLLVAHQPAHSASTLLDPAKSSCPTASQVLQSVLGVLLGRRHEA